MLNFQYHNQCNAIDSTESIFAAEKMDVRYWEVFFKGNVQLELENSARYGEVSAIKYPFCKGLPKSNLREINPFLRSVRYRVVPAVNYVGYR